MKMFKSLILKSILVAALLFGMFVVLTSFVNSKTNPNSKEAPTRHTVTIFRMKFQPAHLQVKKGDTVVWVNKDFVPHDVTEELHKEWTSKPLKQGEQWSKVIQDGFKYYCDLHKVMKGTITITK